MKQRLTIDFICHAISGGGAERVMVLLAEKFIEKHHVRIITFNEGKAYNLSDKVEHIELYGGKIPNHTIRSLSNLLGFYRKKENRPDLTIGLMPKINLVSILVSKFYGIPAIGCEHNNHLSDTSNLTRFIQTKVYKLAELITVLTTFDVAFFKRHGVNVKVMPNPATFTPIKEQRLSRNKGILVVGALNKIHQKGWDNLISIIDPVLKKHPDWHLLIAGSGETGLELLKTEVSRHKLETQVQFLGFQEKISETMKKNEIFLMVSRFEGLPMVLIEAMSQGMACISYDCVTGPSEIITNEKIGILVEDQNKQKMSETLNALIDNSAKREFLGRNAPESIAKFNIDLINKSWEEIFDKLVC